MYMVDAADNDKIEASRNELHNLLEKPQVSTASSKSYQLKTKKAVLQVFFRRKTEYLFSAFLCPKSKASVQNSVQKNR